MAAQELLRRQFVCTRQRAVKLSYCRFLKSFWSSSIKIHILFQSTVISWGMPWLPSPGARRSACQMISTVILIIFHFSRYLISSVILSCEVPEAVHDHLPPDALHRVHDHRHAAGVSLLEGLLGVDISGREPATPTRVTMIPDPHIFKILGSSANNKNSFQQEARYSDIGTRKHLHLLLEKSQQL